MIDAGLEFEFKDYATDKTLFYAMKSIRLAAVPNVGDQIAVQELPDDPFLEVVQVAFTQDGRIIVYTTEWGATNAIEKDIEIVISCENLAKECGFEVDLLPEYEKAKEEYLHAKA